MKMPKAIANHPGVKQVTDGESEGAPESKYWVYLKPGWYFTADTKAGGTCGGFESVERFVDSKAEYIGRDMFRDGSK